jgi:hypothetical protein
MSGPDHLATFLNGVYTDVVSAGGPCLPPVTNEPVHVGDLPITNGLVSVWADRPARGFTRIYLADQAGFGCGDACLDNSELTLSLPDAWSDDDKVRAACVIVLVAYRRADGQPNGPDMVALGSVPHTPMVATSNIHR